MPKLYVDTNKIENIKKKISKLECRSERGVETLFKLLSQNQYKLNTMVDRKSSILITTNALVLSLVLGPVMAELHAHPHLLYAVVLTLFTNVGSIALAICATRPELVHGKLDVNNLLFYGNFNAMEESDYIKETTRLMDQGDELYKVIARDTYYLGKIIEMKSRLLRKSFSFFLVGITLSVLSFLFCRIFGKSWLFWVN